MTASTNPSSEGKKKGKGLMKGPKKIYKKKKDLAKNKKYAELKAKQAEEIASGKRKAPENKKPVKQAKIELESQGPVSKPVGLHPTPGVLSSNWKMLQQSLATSKGPEGKGKRANIKRTKFTEKTQLDRSEKVEAQAKEEGEKLWFDDVDPALVEKESGQKVDVGPDGKEGLTTGTFDGVTKHMAMDCEMVGVGPEGTESVLARVAIVNAFGVCVYDKFVKPKERVTDYRTFVSGITPEMLVDAEDFESVQMDVFKLTKGCILVGHALHHDLKVLMLSHPRKMIRDTCTYPPFRALSKGRSPGLKRLTKDVLKITIQEGEHTPVEDAQAAMLLYKRHEKEWEKYVRKQNIGLVAKERKEKKDNEDSEIVLPGLNGEATENSRKRRRDNRHRNSKKSRN